jgi:hypothetical protein
MICNSVLNWRLNLLVTLVLFWNICNRIILLWLIIPLWVIMLLWVIIVHRLLLYLRYSLIALGWLKAKVYTIWTILDRRLLTIWLQLRLMIWSIIVVYLWSVIRLRIKLMLDWRWLLLLLNLSGSVNFYLLNLWLSG